MQKVHFQTSPTDKSKEMSDLVDVILVLLNRVTVELTLESQKKEQLHEDQFRVAVRLIHSACALGTMLPDLIREQSIRLPYALPLTRMYYERLLSAAYVLSDDGAAARQAIHYSSYSIFKNQKKFFSVGGYKELISDRFQLSRQSKAVADALEYFSNSKAPKEYEHDRVERCEIIKKASSKAALLFHSVEQAGYSLSSEIVHGSYLSTILYTDQQRELTKQKGLEETSTWIVMTFAFSSEALGHLLEKLFPSLPSPPLLIEAGKTFSLMEAPEAAELIERAYPSN